MDNFVGEINEMLSIKFDGRDIWLHVERKDASSTYEQIIDHRTLCMKHDVINRKWLIKWKPSWIKLTQLSQSGIVWSRFYSTKIYPAIQQINMNNDDHDVIICNR